MGSFANLHNDHNIETVSSFNSIIDLMGGNTMILFIAHPYTNNIAHSIVGKLPFGNWYVTFLVSLCLLQGILYIKQKFENRGIFKYV